MRALSSFYSLSSLLVSSCVVTHGFECAREFNADLSFYTTVGGRHPLVVCGRGGSLWLGSAEIGGRRNQGGCVILCVILLRVLLEIF